MKSKTALFHAKLCSVCNDFYIAGSSCKQCEIDDLTSKYHAKLIAQNKLLESGVVVPTDEYGEMVDVIRCLVSDIETPHRLGVADRINPNWDALNRAKRIVTNLDTVIAKKEETVEIERATLDGFIHE